MTGPSAPAPFAGRWRTVAVALAVAALLAGCSAALRRGDGYAHRQEWLKAVVEYRAALRDDPDNAELRARLVIAEQRAADHYYARGQALTSQGKLDAAAAEFQKGMASMPGNDKLVQALAACVATREAERDVQEALTLERAGSLALARQVLQDALELAPESAPAKAALARIALQEAPPALRLLPSRSMATLRFEDTGARAAFAFLARSFAINIMFDEAVEDRPVTVFARDVTVEQALGLVLASTRTFYKQLGPATIVIVPDTPAKREQYEDLVIRTFPLNTVKASDMAAILKGVLNLKRVTANEVLRTVIVRDTVDRLSLAEQLIQANDRKPAEVLLEVEILEINRTKAEQLGLNYGSQAVAYFPETTIGTLIRGGAGEVFRQAVVTLPQVEVNLFKRDVDAKVLANPKIRVLDGKPARIHVGDRVPLRTSMIQDATGQVRVTFDYKDIGIKVESTPTINLDNSVMVKVNLEVSTLGANLGTQSEPSYAIGARDVDTMMMLRDGETALVGGLLRDEERRTYVKIPGLGDIPVVGWLFTTAKYEDVGTTDVVLTLTPHVVRGWSVPPRAQREVYSGNEGRLTSQRSYTYLQGAAEGTTVASVSAVARAEAPPPAPGEPTLAFAEARYEVNAGDDIELAVVGSNLPRMDALPITVAFNPELLRFVSAAPGTAQVVKVAAESKPEAGNIQLQLAFLGGVQPAPSVTLAKLRLRAINPGVSYLIFLNPVIHGADGKDFLAHVTAARLVVR